MIMTDIRTALVGWKKGMTSIAQTYIVEIEGATAHFTRVGKGGAHWSPDYLAMGMAANGMNPNNPLQRTYAMRNLQVAAGSALGAVAGDKILEKFRQEIEANIAIFQSQGRSGLDHKSNMSIPASDIAAASFLTKFPRGGPPALRALEGPHAETKIDGKRWYLFQLPDTPLLSELIAAAR